MGKPDGDITPGHLPVALLRTALEMADRMEAVACAVVLVDKDNHRCWYDSVGHENQGVLWAVKHLEMEVLGIKYGDEEED